MKLFFAPRSRTVRLRWLLEELGVPYELARLDPQNPQAQAALAVHPPGLVPTLVDGDLTLFEPSALCFVHLADRFPEQHLAPPPGSAERGAYLHWLGFAECVLEPAVMGFHRFGLLPPAQRSSAPEQEALARLRPRLTAALDFVDVGLSGRDFAVSGHFTAADVLLSVLLHLANQQRLSPAHPPWPAPGELIEGHPRLFDYLKRHTQRPASIKAATT